MLPDDSTLPACLLAYPPIYPPPPPPCSPLVLGRRPGRRGEEWCVASEDCAFGPIGFERVRDVRPGEMIIIDENGNVHSRQVAEVRAGPAG